MAVKTICEAAVMPVYEAAVMPVYEAGVARCCSLTLTSGQGTWSARRVETCTAGAAGGPAAIRVIVPPAGVGFGGKHGDEAVEAARLARGAGRPVQVHWSRAEEFQCGFLRPMAVIDVRAGLDAEGSVTAWDFLDINAGANGFAFPYAVPRRRLRYQPALSPYRQGP